jgi:hypothetical protein
MRKYFMTAFVLAAMLLVATSGLALEKTMVPMKPNVEHGWDAAASCSVFYANTCTGWLSVWSPFAAGDKVGLILDPCCPNGQLITTQAYFWTGSPGGYGFTGTIELSSNAGGCPGVSYGTFAELPPAVGGPVINNWVGVPAGSAILTYEVANSIYPDPLTIPTDSPGAGPTGPQACGLCYPSTRQTHSFVFAAAGTPLCPGSTFADVCDAELLFWGGLFTGCPVSVEESSWGSVKNLYR